MIRVAFALLFACMIPCVALTQEKAQPKGKKAAGPLIGHMVYFKLKESTPANREKLVAACDKYLADHEGVVFYSAGVLAEELDRDVNDRDWDVALHVVFANKAAHDKYQTHPEHLKFIEENKDTWAKVRVFDSSLNGVKMGRKAKKKSDK